MEEAARGNKGYGHRASYIEYDSIYEATLAWKDENKPECRDRERGAFIYMKTDRLTQAKAYIIGRTYQGVSGNVIAGFIAGYLSGVFSGFFSRSVKIVGFIHTHPAPKPGMHNDFPSNADLFLLKLPGIDEVYVVPWKHCPGTPDIIKASDRQSWEH